MARALRAWAVSERKKTRSVTYSTDLVRGISRGHIWTVIFKPIPPPPPKKKNFSLRVFLSHEGRSWTKCSCRRFVMALHRFRAPILLAESSCQFDASVGLFDSTFYKFDSSLTTSVRRRLALLRFVVSLWLKGQKVPFDITKQKNLRIKGCWRTLMMLLFSISRLRTSETCFVVSKKCSHQRFHYTNHGWNMIILSMTETTSRGSFNHDQTKHVQNGGWVWRGGACPKEPTLEQL